MRGERALVGTSRHLRRGRSFLLTVTIMVVMGCSLGTEDASPTDPAALDEWRQDLLDAPREPDEDAFCAVLAATVAGREPRTVIILDPEIGDEQIGDVADLVEDVTGLPPRRLSREEVQRDVTELFATFPGAVDQATIDALGPRLEVPPIPDGPVEQIREHPAVEQVTVTPAVPSTGTGATVIGTIQTLWPTRFSGADLILFVDPGRGDEPLDDLEAAIRRDHPDAVVSIERFTQEDSFEEFEELFADDPKMVASVSAEVMPASVRILATSLDGVDEIDADYRDDPRIDEVIRIEPSFHAMQQVGTFLTEDLPDHEEDALTELARTAPEDLLPDVHTLIRAFPGPEALAMSHVIVGPDGDAAIPRRTWEETVPAVKRLEAFAIDRCGLRRTDGS